MDIENIVTHTPVDMARAYRLVAQGGPGLNAAAAVVAERLREARHTYETTPASEFTRGQVDALRGVYKFLTTGEQA